MDTSIAPIVNKVAASSLITIDLEDFRPQAAVVSLDMADFLEGGFLLREKEFRTQVRALDTASFAGKAVAITCSTDAIVPTWAYMLLTLALQPVAHSVQLCSIETMQSQLWEASIRDGLIASQFIDQKIVVKGCSDGVIPESAWVVASQVLGPVVSSLMFGEACSAVPLYKRPKQG